MLRYAAPSTKIAVLGTALILLSAVCGILIIPLSSFSTVGFVNQNVPDMLVMCLFLCGLCLLVTGMFSVLAAILVYLATPDASRICNMVKKGLFAYENGNPLNLKEGERLPAVKCKGTGLGAYEVTITAAASKTEDIAGISGSISSSLCGRYRNYAVTAANVDVAFNEVRFTVEDVAVHKELVLHSVYELRPKELCRLIVQQGTYIDLTTSGSILCAGKTRSGKTTGIIALLLQALLAGRDEYGSQIVIIDPKQAELSRLPHTYTLDENGEATGILDAIKSYADSIVMRQKVLNDLSEQSGDTVHWWDAGMHVSFLFIDEYVAARTMFPKRTGKDASGYSLQAFDDLIKRIVTMGASAGCYAVISIAEASVTEGGLSQMLKSAMTTKVLFKPTMTEGRFMWEGDRMKDFPERVYSAGDAWFSSTDGVHDNVTFVHFPMMEFPVYRELGRLLEAYYGTE